MNYRETFSSIYNVLSTLDNSGQTAQYIPELAQVDPEKFGVSLYTNTGELHSFGDAQEKFSIQSIVKVLSLALAYKKLSIKIWERVSVEPSGTPFNSLVQLEYEKGIPRNPFINAGAIVVADILISVLENPEEEFLAFIHSMIGDTSIEYNTSIAASEKSCAHRNLALVNLMKSFGNINNDIDKVMDFYFNICSICMTTDELAKVFSVLSNKGISLVSKEEILTPRQTKRINAIMQTCGFYDESGEFAFKVGLPGKSGVGGGIVAVHPGEYSIAVWSPKLNKKGNSLLGSKFLEAFTTAVESSIF